MKKKLALLFIVFGLTSLWCQEEMHSEYLGDHFSLEGALSAFKKATSLEQFEHLLNLRNSNVNNLDLNNDGAVDYINVEDISSGNSHIIILRTYLTETEKQDIAILSLDKTGDTEVFVQIEGDSALYAENTVIVPTEEQETSQNNNGGPEVPEITVRSVFVNAWTWPCVRFIYGTSYVLWVSPYRWHYYPTRWHAWRPVTYALFYSRSAPHRLLFHSVGTRRIVAARTVYYANRHPSILALHTKSGTPIYNRKRYTRSLKVMPTQRIPVRTLPARRTILSGLGIKRAGRR